MSSLSSTTLAKPDIQLADGPDDSISALAFSPVTNHLAVTSWDSKLRLYDLTQSPTGQGKALVNFDAPVLDCHWSKVSSLERTPILNTLKFGLSPLLP